MILGDKPLISEVVLSQHIKSEIGYKNGDKHNSRVNTKGQEFIEFTKANVQQEKKQGIKTTNNVSYSYANASHVSHMSYHDFNASYVLMRLSLVKLLLYMLGHITRAQKLVCGFPSALLLT
jgi:hypothetical protein